MHDLMVAVSFIGMVIAPCVMARRTRVAEMDEED